MDEDLPARAPQHVIITGCGRSGTGFIAEVMNRLGLPCGHERAVRPDGFKGWGDLVGDVSWFAPPYLHQMPADTVILHQVRHPRRVIESWYRLGLFGDRPWRTVYANPRRTASYVLHPRKLPVRYADYHEHRRVVRENSNVFQEDDELLRCFRYWLEWNLLAEERALETRLPYLRYRVEEINEEFVRTVLHMIGAHEVSEEALHVAMGTPSDTNRKSEYRSRRRTWPSFASTPGLLELSHRYGYDDLQP